MDELGFALRDAGGATAPRERTGRLRELLLAELRHGARELDLPRSGRARPVTVAIAAGGDALLAVVPVPATVRADPAATSERGWLLTAATLGALLELAQPPPPSGPQDLIAQVGVNAGHLVLRVPTTAAEDPDLAVVAFEEHVASVARLRARALAVPAALLDPDDVRAPLTSALRGAEMVARLGGRPADPDSMAEHEEAALALLEGGSDPTRPGASRPHDDPDPARRAARRILQRLNGMGKWGGYHTNITHLSRGFAPSERGMVDAVGEQLLAAGLLESKPSVGQRHVYLNPRRAGDIHRLIDEAVVPAGLELRA